MKRDKMQLSAGAVSSLSAELNQLYTKQLRSVERGSKASLRGVVRVVVSVTDKPDVHRGVQMGAVTTLGRQSNSTDSH